MLKRNKLLTKLQWQTVPHIGTSSGKTMITVAIVSVARMHQNVWPERKQVTQYKSIVQDIGRKPEYKSIQH